MYQQKRRMSVGNTRRGSVIDLVENDDEVAEDVPIEGTMQVGRDGSCAKIILDDRNTNPYQYFPLLLRTKGRFSTLHQPL